MSKKEKRKKTEFFGMLGAGGGGGLWMIWVKISLLSIGASSKLVFDGFV